MSFANEAAGGRHFSNPNNEYVHKNNGNMSTDLVDYY